jgi:hypothetical protein
MAVIGALGWFQGDEPAFRAWIFTLAGHRPSTGIAKPGVANRLGPG